MAKKKVAWSNTSEIFKIWNFNFYICLSKPAFLFLGEIDL